MTHPNYYADHFRGQIVYRCCMCAHDTFAHDNAIAHQQTHPRITLRDEPPPPDALCGMRIVIGVITSQSDWPTKSVYLAHQEADRLCKLGAEASVYWVDNGLVMDNHVSVNTYDRVDCGKPSLCYGLNMGQSIARNAVIDHAVGEPADYLAMVDGDIHVIPYSVAAAVLQFMRSNDKVGCIGFYSRNCTHLPHDDIAPYCMDVHKLLGVGPHMAWTQYGVFDCSMFRLGLRFDTSPVFQGEGWGFEDDDMACWMLAHDWYSVNTKYFRYGHFRMHSSLKAMDRTLAAKVYAERKAFVVNKWANNPLTRPYVEKLVNQTMPVLDF